MEIKLERIIDCLISGMEYFGTTIKISLTAIILGSLFALIIALVRYYHVPVLSQIFALFVTVYRGIPIMLILLIGHLLYVIYFDSVAKALHLSLSIKDVDITLLGYIVLTISATPPLSETFRGALRSIDRSQFEAAYSIGMNRFQTLWRIILPQMFPVAFPGYLNNLVGIIKGVPLLSTAGIVEIMQGSLIPCSVTYSYLEGYAATAIIYFTLITFFLFFAHRLEKHLVRYKHY